MDILYHYCPNSSFHAIVQSRSLWLSSLSLANDSLEGKVVEATIQRLAESDSLDGTSLRRLLEYFQMQHKVIDGLGFACRKNPICPVNGEATRMMREATSRRTR